MLGIELHDVDKIFNPWDKTIKKVYGPYTRKYKRGGDRRQITIYFVDMSTTSMSLARWAMTQLLRRKLDDTQEVDHINEDCMDDRIDNYQIIPVSLNRRKSATGRPSKLKGIEKGWRHGTMYGWMKRKCQCKSCLSNKREYYDKRNKKRREDWAKYS